jgi:hypothetical protein
VVDEGEHVARSGSVKLDNILTALNALTVKNQILKYLREALPSSYLSCTAVVESLPK